MKICLVHNAYGRRSGEEVAVDGLREALERHGHAVVPFFRGSAELDGRRFGKTGAFFSGIYNPAARREFSRLLALERPDVVHINNVFPQISPSIIDEARQSGIPVVMTVHNYRLLCPTGLMMSDGGPCHRCVDGQEWWCAVRNCTGEWPKSLGYAVRGAVSRLRRSFIDGVDRFIAPTEFLKSMLVQHGYPAECIDVIRLLVEIDSSNLSDTAGNYVGYVGRISPEKGIDTIVQAARRCPQIDFRFAGHYLRMPELPSNAPSNCEFIGEIPADEVSAFVSNARFTIFASRWYEISPLSLVDAMVRGKPVVCSRLGGLPEFVEDGVTGLLFSPGNSDELAEKVRYLWERPELCRKMGAAARAKILGMFAPEDNFDLLVRTYQAVRACRANSVPLSA